MKLRLINALDVLGMGGYIDLQTMEYIHPNGILKNLRKKED